MKASTQKTIYIHASNEIVEQQVHIFDRENDNLNT